MAKKILGMLYDTDILFLDEGHIINQSTKASLPVGANFIIPTSYKQLTKFYERWVELNKEAAGLVKEVIEEGQQNPSGKHLARQLPKFRKTLPSVESKEALDDVVGYQDQYKMSGAAMSGAFYELAKWAETVHGKDATEMILGIKNLITILSSDDMYVNYLTIGGVAKVFISAGSSSLLLIISKFVYNSLNRNKTGATKKVIITSGTIIEPDLIKTFERAANVKGTYVLLPDFNHTTAKMTLVPWRYELTTKIFGKKLPEIVADIKNIVAHENQPVYIVAMNRDYTAKILAEIGKDAVFWVKYGKMLRFDYYRSDETMGVEHKERVCVAVGFAETPGNSADVGIIGRSEYERWFRSQSKRQQDVDATTWQTLCRVKDPEGKVESRVYCIGCGLAKVRRVCTWGVGRAEDYARIDEEPKFGKPRRHAYFDVSVAHPLPLPRVRTEDAEITSARAVRRNLDDYILLVLKNGQGLGFDELKRVSFAG